MTTGVGKSSYIAEVRISSEFIEILQLNIQIVNRMVTVLRSENEQDACVVWVAVSFLESVELHAW